MHGLENVMVAVLLVGFKAKIGVERRKWQPCIDLKSNILTQKCFASLLVRYWGTCKMQLDSHRFDKPSRKNMQIEEPKSNSFIP